MNWFNSRIYQAVVTLFVDLRIVSWKKCDSETGTCFVFLEFQCSGIVNTRVIPRLCWWTYFDFLESQRSSIQYILNKSDFKTVLVILDSINLHHQESCADLWSIYVLNWLIGHHVKEVALRHKRGRSAIRKVRNSLGEGDFPLVGATQITWSPINLWFSYLIHCDILICCFLWCIDLCIPCMCMLWMVCLMLNECLI